MWISQSQRFWFLGVFSTSQSFKNYGCSVNINRWNWWWDHIWNINYLISCQMKYCGSQDSFLSKQKKKKNSPEEEGRHINYYIIILVYLLLHLVFPFVMYACNYRFKSYLGYPNPLPRSSTLPCFLFAACVTWWFESYLNIHVYVSFILLLGLALW